MTTSTIGSVTDMLSRLKAVLPSRWFPDETPILDGLLTGLAGAAATLYGMLAYVRQQTRVATLTDSFIDLAATDYCGNRLVRRVGESDAVFRARLQRELLRSRATRGAMAAAVGDLTGRQAAIFEPARAADTGGWGVALGYGAGGGWGSNVLPFQFFVSAYRPFAAGAAAWTAGSNVPGAPLAEAAALVQGTVRDAEIYAAIAAAAPCATIAWTVLID
jgi:hypothetical protein